MPELKPGLKTAKLPIGLKKRHKQDRKLSEPSVGITLAIAPDAVTAHSITSKDRAPCYRLLLGPMMRIFTMAAACICARGERACQPNLPI